MRRFETASAGKSIFAHSAMTNCTYNSLYLEAEREYAIVSAL
jgi:hypothetical protein